MKSDVIVVLTTSNPEQNKLDTRLLQNMILPCAVATVCDNENEGSIGSGGAFLQVLDLYYGQYKKIIVINSGGYSKRAMNYAVKGKGFAHFHQNGKEVTLLECIIENVCRLACRFREGAIVCCSDILVQTDKMEIDFDDNVGFCVPADLQTASRHGVMVENAEGYLQHYLHKKPSAMLQAYTEGAQTALLDTGMVYFCKETLQTLYAFSQKTQFVDCLKKSAEQLCLYEDIVGVFSLASDKNAFLEKTSQSALKKARSELYSALTPYRMRVCNLERAFIHFGTMRESVANIRFLSGSQHIFHSFISEKSRCAKSAVLDNVCLNGACEIGDNCLMSDVVLTDVSIQKDTNICGIKLKDGGFVCIVTSIFENPKDTVNGQPIWEIPRFYKAGSFDASYRDFIHQKNSAEISMKECLEQADYGFCTLLYDYIQTQIDRHHFGQYLEYRERIISRHFADLPIFDFSRFVQPYVQVHLPVRVNLAGTWTDAMPYCIDHGGKMLNMAVTCEGALPIQVRAESIDEHKIEFETNGKKEVFQPGIQNELSDFNLFHAVLKTIGLRDANALAGGFRLSVQVMNIDHGSGLGVSSIILAGCFLALNRLFGLGLTKKQIVSFVFAAEQIMGTGGGWQDQIGALYSGIKLSASLPGIPQAIQVSTLNLKENIEKMIAGESVLIPTGISHFGKSIVGDVMERYLSGNAACLSGFEAIYHLNELFLQAIETDNTDFFCDCVNRHAQLLKNISHETVTRQTEQMAKTLQPYVRALSLCGAGGGGYFYAVLKENVTPLAFKEIFASLFPAIQSTPKQINIYRFNHERYSDDREETD